ncbi:DUF3277 family protein [Paenibacillus thiaminolyticus]|uniref:phage structural protein n=1 Tax=Paenibacillus TaxID=44249 RepID=UPI0011652E50|nr:MULTISPECIES: phage protein [Paenibacillus]MBG9794457.1 hypothetical protein [Paenibacillus dendritiformis]MDU5142420.1 phage protein [Paenibacillus dendritiformis]NGP58391.1 DUF3277 family protein [Paenibacillus thiaminolyticus]NKI23247.1 DUF3277 family protein [Paenibacillus dendritiformis]NRF98032.1 DUF3277 family protein [Paenibacillus dendritiformis]
MSIGIYDAKQVSVVIDGEYITGFGENTFVSCEKDEEQSVAHVGARGEVAIAHKNNPLGTIKLTLMSTSPQIALLHRLAREKKLFSIWVKSNNEPGETIGGTQAIVKKLPAAAYGSELEDREFEIQVLDYTHRVN